MINENQLQTWSSAPSPTEMGRIKKTREIIEEVLKSRLPIDEIKKKWNMVGFRYDIYLQGSYANSTNVRFDSDVDIVVQLNSVFGYDTSKLGELEKISHETHYPSSSLYQFNQFKTDIYDALVAEFGSSSTHWANKCLKIDGNTNRVNADVIPCFQYKLYKRFISLQDQDFVEGIRLYNSSTGERIINYPKVHLSNCESKNVDTDGKFKDLVRIYKNMRNNLVDKGELLAETAPSYFIENLLYNCTSPCFDGLYTDCMLKSFDFIVDAIDSGRITGFICANEQDNLISPTTWNLQDLIIFMNKITSYFLEKTEV